MEEAISNFMKWMLWCDGNDKCRLPKVADAIGNRGKTRQYFKVYKCKFRFEPYLMDHRQV